jgi:hypothetical protein
MFPDSHKVAAGGRVFQCSDAVGYWDGEESRA